MCEIYHKNVTPTSFIRDPKSKVLPKHIFFRVNQPELSHLCPQNKLYTLSVAESEARNSLELELRARERRKEYGLTQEEEDADEMRRQEFSRITLPHLERELKIICQNYQVKK